MSQSGSEEVEERFTRLEQQDERLTRALELLAQREAAPTAKPGRDWNAYAAIIASCIGILALVVSGYTAQLQRQQLRAQMWPYLELRSSNVDLIWKVMNKGTGPARVTAARVTVGGAPVRTWSDIKQAAGFTSEEGLLSSTLGTAVLSPGADVTIARPADNEQSRAKFKELLPGHQHALLFTVCYCSVLDECWVAYSGMRDKDELRDGACPITVTEKFAD